MKMLLVSVLLVSLPVVASAMTDNEYKHLEDRILSKPDIIRELLEKTCVEDR